MIRLAKGEWSVVDLCRCVGTRSRRFDSSYWDPVVITNTPPSSIEIIINLKHVQQIIDLFKLLEPGAVFSVFLVANADLTSDGRLFWAGVGLQGRRCVMGNRMMVMMMMMMDNGMMVTVIIMINRVMIIMMRTQWRLWSAIISNWDKWQVERRR